MSGAATKLLSPPSQPETNVFKLQILIFEIVRIAKDTFKRLYREHFPGYNVDWDNEGGKEVKLPGFTPFFKNDMVHDLYKGIISHWDSIVLAEVFPNFSDYVKKENILVPPGKTFSHYKEPLEKLKEIRHKLAHLGTLYLDDKKYNNYLGVIKKIAKDFDIPKVKEQTNFKVKIVIASDMTCANDVVTELIEGYESAKQEKYPDALEHFENALCIAATRCAEIEKIDKRPLQATYEDCFKAGNEVDEYKMIARIYNRCQNEMDKP